MVANLVADTLWIVVLNAVLGLACLAAVAAVVVGVVLDVRERRRWRAMVPDGWPPTGVDPEDAYATPAVGANDLHEARKEDET